jgi:hypothetical protein
MRGKFWENSHFFIILGIVVMRGKFGLALDGLDGLDWTGLYMVGSAACTERERW